MWPFRRKPDDDESSYESYSSYEEYDTDDEHEDETHEPSKEAEVDGTEQVKNADGSETGEPVQDSSAEPKELSKDQTQATAVTQSPVADVVTTDDQDNQSVESSSSEEEESDDDDLVLVQPDDDEEENESIEEAAGMSYDSEYESDTGAVEDPFDTNEKSYDTAESEEEEDSSDEEEEGPSSLSEKQSLLALAAEHDRVDILKAILAENAQEQTQLLHSPIPPLHVAVSYGSTHATSCLLRMGANPAIRPNIAEIRKTGDKTAIDTPNLARYDGVTAWELAFGRTRPLETGDTADKTAVESNDKDEPTETKRNWFGVFGGSSGMSSTKSLEEEAPKDLGESPTSTPTASTHRSTVKPVDMAPSKREGVRHAFTAEALRCIGADEMERLQQLLDSGMPSDINVGGKTLHGWCLEMGALHCEPLIRPLETEEEIVNQDVSENSVEEESPASKTREAESEPIELKVSGAKESLASLSNRREELESLATALSTLLDNLAEEVSVCHGLLLSGGGAKALASHVRSLKELRGRRQDELVHWTQEWEKGEDELAYWAREYGSKYDDDFPATSLVNFSRHNSFREPQTAEEEESQRRQLLAQLAASENKVRKLRASITDLSEENTRDLEEVERRSLTGGVKLVRSLREEIREVEFKLSEAKSGEAACRARVSLIQSRLEVARKAAKAAPKPIVAEKPSDETSTEKESQSIGEKEDAANGRETQDRVADEAESQMSREVPTDNSSEHGPSKRQSEVIKTGDSTALIVHQGNAGGFLTADLWDLFLRIIGMGREAVRRSAENIRGSTSNVMIV